MKTAKHSTRAIVESLRHWDHEAGRPERVNVEAADGSRIVLDTESGAKFFNLEADTDSYTDSGWPGCDFRFDVGIASVAVNVHVTGRKERYGHTCQIKGYGGLTGIWVRVRVEFVGDCEPSSFCNGYLRLRD